MSLFPDELPALDAHAHLAPDVTGPQLRRLGPTVLFAMTRSLAEADYVSERADAGIVWGLGMHPTSYRDLQLFDVDEFVRLLGHFALIGEIGLDFRGGRRQLEIFDQILRAIEDKPVLVSIHSTGMVADVLTALRKQPHRGALLHWFVGTDSELQEAVDLGCNFSVNAAMTDDQIARLPIDRVLAETDYPAATQGGAKRPGDVNAIEDRIARLWNLDKIVVRHRIFQNARRLSLASGAIERMPMDVVGHLLAT